MAVQTLNLRGVILVPQSYCKVVPAKSRERVALTKYAPALPAVAGRIVSASVGFLWLLVVGAAVGLAGLWFAARHAVTPETIGREIADFVICLRLMVPALSVLGMVLLEEAVNYAKGNSRQQ